MSKFKSGDKVIEPRTGDIGVFECYDIFHNARVKWVTGDNTGRSISVHACDIEHLSVPEDEVTPTEIMYNGKIYVLKGE